MTSDPIPHHEFVKAVRRYAAEVCERVNPELTRPGQAYTILTMCRVLHVLRTGKQASKKQAAAWVQQEFPEWSGLIRKAFTWRQAAKHKEQVDHAETLSETKRFVDFINAQILS